MPSTHASEAEDDVNSIPIASLTLDVPLQGANSRRKVPKQPFNFLGLPSELRLRVYEYYFADVDDLLDLDPDNYKRYHKRLGIIRACKRLHVEVTHYFYSSRTFRIFPTHPARRYTRTKRPLLARLNTFQRQCINSVQLCLGPGWASPPKGWVINDSLGLQDLRNVSCLKVFVQLDPSDAVLKDYRRAEGFYEKFSQDLLVGILDQMPNVTKIEFDGYKSVKKSGDMMQGLLETATRCERQITWGPIRGWTDEDDNDGPPEVANAVQFANAAALGAFTIHNIGVLA